MTLVEVSVAAAIGLGLFLMLFGSMRGSARRFQAGESGLEATLQAQRIFEYLRKDLQGPDVWGPCDTPDEVLQAIGGVGGPINFGMLRREVDLRVEYYVDGLGPTEPSTDHTAGPIRKPVPGTPPGVCPLAWAPKNAIWIKGATGREGLKDQKAHTHPIEFVRGNGGNRKDAWVLGPAFWIYDHEAKLLRRWDAKNGFAEFGAGRLVKAAIRPLVDFSYDWRTDPPPPFPSMADQKIMLNVTLKFERDADRPPLEIQHALTRQTGQS
jgi:hypothetical protein